MQDDKTAPERRYGWRTVAGVLGLGAVAAASAIRARKLSKVSPALRSAAMIATPSLPPFLIPLTGRITRQMDARAATPPGVQVSERRIPSASGDPDVRVVILQREGCTGTRPALLWLHGGGYVIGSPEMDYGLLARILEGADVTIVSVDYRLSPRDPFPAPVDDAMAALRWVLDQSEALGIDTGSIAVGGVSAGGGLAASVAQRARDEGVSLAFQLLMYPMLDDRTVCRTDHEGRGELVWNPRSNRYGWSCYLGTQPGGDRTPQYAAPARTKNLAGLPPAWIGVGSLDLFYEEDVAYTENLSAAGVACDLERVADAPHAFDLLNFDTQPARQFHESMIAALVSALERRKMQMSAR